ncbi:MAG: hypothetical protein LBE36_08115 [Flavobacteriaceae bacterium]|nr:hypothetical protein [Flavobacteriaceae bacterium]
MKNLFLITSILLSAFLVSCNNDDAREVPENDIVGTWKLVAQWDGGSPSQDWLPVAIAYTYTFDSDGTFSSTVNVNCVQGTYILTDDKLIFNFDCGTFPPIGDNGTVINNFTWDESYFILTPTDSSCDEGCKFKFQKQNN